MNFLGIGPGELFLIMLLALIVFGPGRLPEIGAGLGRAIGEFRRATTDITREITRELQVETAQQEPRRQAAAAEEPRRPEEPAAEQTSEAGLAAEAPRVALRVAGEAASLPPSPVEAPTVPRPVDEAPVAPTIVQEQRAPESEPGNADMAPRASESESKGG